MAADKASASQETVHAAQRGDGEALEALMARHIGALRAYVRARASPEFRAHESCSDVVQSACRQALEHLGEFEWRGEESFRRWLFALTANKLLNRVNYHRAERRDRRREAPDPAALLEAYSSVMTPSQDAIGREFTAQFEAAMDQLPENYREVLLLARVVQLSHTAIAEQLGISEELVRTRLLRARVRLAGLLDLGRSDGGAKS